MFQQLLEQIAKELDHFNIPYMLIGGQAVLLYGEPRLTKDIDITLGVGPDRISDLLQLVQVLNFQVLVNSPEKFVGETMVLPCLEPKSGIRVDFILSHSAYEQKALQRVRQIKMGKTLVRFASPEDLIIHKVIAGRPRDMEDVRTVLLKQPAMDLSYIRQWLKRFSKDLNESFLDPFEEILKDTE